jgi:hypothetical protein
MPPLRWWLDSTVAALSDAEQDRQLSAFEAKFQAFVDDALKAAADGLTLAEVADLVGKGIAVAVEAARELTAPGADKKALVMLAVTQLYDTLTGFLPIYLRFLAPIVRPWVLAWIDGQIEAVYRFIEARLPVRMWTPPVGTIVTPAVEASK